ncbi:MAG TPA: hypothetical protein VGX25_19015 [Actinophytocola sp.]|uniref:hypothetical protein n=1 Tax=Actinophytocola sp. TaxID=1872138 RepID=UPI002DDD8F92|nr:hypothetical protein [Actinophytocola sp.]HEV2781478.1 hypothetical protein [Actinophytocola sp.]
MNRFTRRISGAIFTIIVGLAVGWADAGADTTSHPSQPAKVSPRILGPNGYGGLQLGMTFADARAAGYVREDQPPDPPCRSYDLYRRGKRVGRVFISPDRGVEAIAPEERVRTAEGVKIGWPAERVKEVYPDLRLDLLPEFGALTVQVPGNPAARYRLGFSDHEHVSDIILHLADQPCAE